MMLVSAAFLFAVSAGCGVWYVLRMRALRFSLSERLAHLPRSLNFPYNFQNTDQVEASHSVMSVEESYENKLSRKLYLAGFRDKAMVLKFQWILRLCAILPGLMLFLGILSGSLSTMLIVRAAMIGVGLLYMVNFYVGIRRKKIISEMNRTLPQMLDLLIVSMEAGLNFSAALPRVLQEMDTEDSLIKEFRVMNHEYLGGLSFAQACTRMGKRCDFGDLSVILNAIIESEQTGASLAYVLRIHAHELRDKYRQRMREKAHKLPVKLIFPMMLIFITIFTIALGPSVFRMKGYISDFKSNKEVVKVK
jgi:tight adherence protein C